MQNWVILNADNKIHNIIHWDGNLETWQPPDGYLAILEAEINIDLYEWETPNNA